MRLLLTAPLPRWYLLFAKLLAGPCCRCCRPMSSWPSPHCSTSAYRGRLAVCLPVLVLSGMMLGALGLLLSVHVKQLENFAGTMNFVIFPMFFVSPALYPSGSWRVGCALHPSGRHLESLYPCGRGRRASRSMASCRPCR